ncbi:hypothetical protein BH09PSE6_BH09PSE6_29250 [soil metagenome]
MPEPPVVAESAAATSAERGLADARFMAVARLLGSRAERAPEPVVEHHDGSAEYGYVDQSSAKRGVVTIDAAGEVSSAVFGP